MAKTKEERQKKAAKRTRGNFVSVYGVMSVKEIVDNAEKYPTDQLVLLRLVDENAACSNYQEARTEAAEQGITGTLLASRRCGVPWERVQQTVINDVELQNVDGFNEVYADHKQQKEED